MTTIMNKTSKHLPDPAEVDRKTKMDAKGLTIDEIRHRRALVLLQKEFCKEKMQFNALKMKNNSPFSPDYNGKSKPLGRVMSLAGKFIGGMNYIDYAVIGLSMFANVRKAIKKFKKK